MFSPTFISRPRELSSQTTFGSPTTTSTFLVWYEFVKFMVDTVGPAVPCSCAAGLTAGGLWCVVQVFSND